ncbi:MAG: hypothetical protein PHQ18_00475 [Patescibacteria group bacterium]|nr:hypothetical protein [Patescibacteria group bacterium]
MSLFAVDGDFDSEETKKNKEKEKKAKEKLEKYKNFFNIGKKAGEKAARDKKV